MGIIKAIKESVRGTLESQWLEVYEPAEMGEHTVFTIGVPIQSTNNQSKADAHISNGSIVHVYENQFMMLTVCGKVVDYTAEPGYYEVDDVALPSFFNGELGEVLEDSLNRIRYNGQVPTTQKVYYINLQEIKGIKFGTSNPLNYFDNFYNAELFLRAYGTYSIKITNPLLFYKESIPRNKDQVEINQINDQYRAEFLEALQAAINQMSIDGIRVSHVLSKSRELGKYMANVLDEEWKVIRGMEICSVGIAGITYDEKTTALINMRNEGAMLADAAIGAGYYNAHIAQGLKEAGANANGAAAGYLGIGLGLHTSGHMATVAAPQHAPQEIRENNEVNNKETTWICTCGTKNNNNFCQECGKASPNREWICQCGNKNKGKFCGECGTKRP
jgi:membrane protease subunit (stomatin/prohibitin family)